MKYRTILHLDLDAFFCAVEEQRDPSLRGKPFAVGGRPETRGVVASCSYSARQFGIRSAMPMARAVRLCPELTIVPHRHRDYSEVSRSVMHHLHTLTSQVEQISIDEAFMDVSDHQESGEAIARRLQALIRDELGLPSSLGVATNKLVAKIATNVGKAAHKASGPPFAIQVVPPGHEAAFLAPLPVEALWGVGPKTAIRLARLGIHTIGDLAERDEQALAKIFGSLGHEMARRSRGVDERPIVTHRITKSISRETTFSRDIRDETTLTNTLMELSKSVAQRLRKARLCGTTVKLKIRWPDFTTLSRQITFEQATDRDEEIFTAAVGLLKGVWPMGRPVRLIGVGVSGLGPRARQLTLWDAVPPASSDPPSERDERLRRAVDDLRKRFGPGIVLRGSEKRGAGS